MNTTSSNTPRNPSQPEGDEKTYAKGGGKETLFRVTIRSQIRLIGILDSKANLVISINTLLITGVLGLLTGSLFFWQETAEFAFKDHLPFLIFLFFSLATMTYAILSTRTDLAIKKFKEMESPIQFTLTHDKKTTLPEYLEYMETVLLSNELIYKNLNLDMYFLSKVVARKSQYLNRAYTLFLAGLIIGIGLFMV